MQCHGFNPPLSPLVEGIFTLGVSMGSCSIASNSWRLQCSVINAGFIVWLCLTSPAHHFFKKLREWPVFHQSVHMKLQLSLWCLFYQKVLRGKLAEMELLPNAEAVTADSLLHHFPALTCLVLMAWTSDPYLLMTRMRIVTPSPLLCRFAGQTHVGHRASAAHRVVQQRCGCLSTVFQEVLHSHHLSYHEPLPQHER